SRRTSCSPTTRGPCASCSRTLRAEGRESAQEKGPGEDPPGPRLFSGRSSPDAPLRRVLLFSLGPGPSAGPFGVRWTVHRHLRPSLLHGHVRNVSLCTLTPRS